MKYYLISVRLLRHELVVVCRRVRKWIPDHHHVRTYVYLSDSEIYADGRDTDVNSLTFNSPQKDIFGSGVGHYGWTVRLYSTNSISSTVSVQSVNIDISFHKNYMI